MLQLLVSYWIKPLQLAYSTSWLKEIQQNRTKQLATLSFLGALTAIFQSAGGWMPGPGFLISPLATAPIVICTLLSIRSGLTAYLLTCAILLVIQPTELLVFPFTTGLLGLGIGIGLTYFNNRFKVMVFSAFLLLAGIAFLLYVVRFPLLGPQMGSSFRFETVGYLFLFCVLYSAAWMEVSIRLLTRLFYSLYAERG